MPFVIFASYHQSNVRLPRIKLFFQMTQRPHLATFSPCWQLSWRCLAPADAHQSSKVLSTLAKLQGQQGDVNKSAFK